MSLVMLGFRPDKTQTELLSYRYQLNRVARKAAFGVSDQVRHKPGYLEVLWLIGRARVQSKSSGFETYFRHVLCLSKKLSSQKVLVMNAKEAVAPSRLD